MGWSGGTEVCVKLWGAVRTHVPEEQRPAVLARVIDVLTDQDWDCVDEIRHEWPEARKALELYDPEFFEDGEEEDEAG